MGYEERKKERKNKKKHHAQSMSGKKTCSRHVEKREDSPCSKRKRKKER
jgi:hypothetical protein